MDRERLRVDSSLTNEGELGVTLPLVMGLRKSALILRILAPRW